MFVTCCDRGKMASSKSGAPFPYLCLKLLFSSHIFLAHTQQDRVLSLALVREIIYRYMVHFFFNILFPNVSLLLVLWNYINIFVSYKPLKKGISLFETWQLYFVTLLHAPILHHSLPSELLLCGLLPTDEELPQPLIIGLKKLKKYLTSKCAYMGIWRLSANRFSQRDRPLLG